MKHKGDQIMKYVRRHETHLENLQELSNEH